MPQFDVTAPTGKTYTVNAPEGATQDEIIQFVQQQVGPAETPQLDNLTPKKGLFDSFTSSIGRGIDRGAITLGDELPALIGSALGQDDYARRQLEEAELARANLEALNPTQIKSYKDIGGVGDFFTYAAESIGENLPNILGIATGVGATSLAAKQLAGSAIKKKLKKETIDKQQEKLRQKLAVAQKKASDQAIIPAAFLGSYALNAPEVFSNVYDVTGELAPGAALLTGSVSAALDSILPTAVVRRLRANPALKAKVVAEAMKKSGTASEVLGAVGLGAGKGFALEGVTESAQEALSLTAERIVGENYEALTSEDFDRFIEAGLRGGLAGSAFGAAGGAQEGLQTRSAALARKAEPPSGTTDATDATTDAAGAADGTTDAEGVRIQDTTQLRQEEFDLSTDNQEFNTEVDALRVETDKEREVIQRKIENIQNKKDTPSRTAALKAQQNKLDKLVTTQQEKFKTLQEKYKITQQKEDPQIDMFAGQTGVPIGTTGAPTTDATTDATTGASAVGDEVVIEDPVVVDPEPDFNEDLLVMEAELKNKDQKEVNQSVRFFKTFNNYLKDKGRTYAEFKENLKDSGSGIAAIEKMLGKPEALKFLAGDIYNAVIDSEKFVIGGKLSRQANETTQDFKQRYAEKELPLEKWNKITEGNQTFGNKTETKEYRNTTKIGTKFAREYYDKLSENDKAKVRQDVIDFVVRGSGYRPIVAGGGLGTKKQAKLEDQEKKKIEDLEKKIVALKSQQDRLVFNGTAEEFNAASAKIQDIESKIQSIRDAAEDRAAKGKPRKKKPSDATDSRRPDKKVQERAAETTAAIAEIEADTPAAQDARAAQLEAEQQAAKEAQDKKQDAGLNVGEVVDGESVARNLDEDTTALETDLDAQDVINEVVAFERALESVNIGTIVEPTTVEETVARLSEINIDVTNNERVSITPTPEAAGLDPSRLSSGVKGVVIKDKAYLFTDNIQRGNEVGVFLHEVGAHVGMVNLVGRKNYNFLVNRVKQFAKLNDGSREHDLAKGALAYIQDVENTTGIKLSPEARDHETIAYFVELAVQNGTRPSEVIKQQSKLSVFFKRLLAGIKSILRKYGRIDPKELDAQSIVDLAYGGAQLATRAPNKKLDFLSSELLFSQATSANAVYDMQTKLLGVANDIAYDEKYAFAVDRLSKGKDSLSTIFYGALSFDQLMDHANRFNPFLASQIKKLGELVSLKRARVDDYNRDITQKLLQVTELQEAATSNMPKEQRDNIIREFNDVTHQSSIDQVDLRKTRVELQQEAADNNTFLSREKIDLISRFEALPAELQQAYVEVINTYETYGNMLLDQITSSLTRKRDQLNNEPDSKRKKEVLSALDKLNLQLQSNRIVPYVPLNRSGEYWIDLEIPSEGGGTEPYTEAFDTRSQAERALNILSKLKDTTVTREVYQRTSGQTFKDMSGQAQAYQQVLQLLQSIDPPRKADERNEHDAVIEKIVQSYYDSFPSTAIKQHFQRRKGIAGYNNDVVQNFATTALKMSNEVANAETSVDINNAIEAIIADSDGKPLAGGEANIRKEIVKRAAFLRNPTPASWARISSAFGYNMYLAGNISSALVNLTQLPLVTYPKLIAEFGVGPATNMMFKLLKQYFKNLASPSIGRDDNTTLTIPGTNASLADVTIFTKDVLKDNGMDKLYTTALQRNLIRRTTSQELQEARQELTKGYSRVNSTRDRLLLTANWAFQNSERANREVGIKAAYELAIDKFTKLKRQGRLDKTTEEIQDLAIERALKITEESSGTALQELGPRWFQSNIGKVVGTFKRFVFSQVYLQYKLTAHALGKALPKNHKSDSSMPIDPDTGEPVDAQKFAREQLAYITLMATIFAGARGVPGMGVATLLYELGADEDDPDYVSFDAWMKARMGDALHRGPMSHYLNIDMSNRIGFNGLLWRRDDQKMEDLGYLYGTMSQLAGPVVSAADQITRGIVRMSDDSRESPIMDGVQMILPAAIRNPMKGMRIYINGAVDKAGRPIVEDVSLYNALMQGVGFNPTEIALAYEKTNILYTKQRALEDKRRGLLNRRFFAHYAGDMDGVAEIDKQIREFNNSKFTQAYKLQIGGATKLRSLKMKLLEANKTYQDVVVPEDVRRRASEAMGGLEVDE